MTQFAVKPTIQLCETVKEFAEAVNLGPKDLLFTNDFLYDPYFAPLSLECPVLFQEKYGLGEPTDEMVEAIYADMPKDVERIVAVGGGTVLDVAKILSLKHVSPILDLYDGKVPVEKGKELILVPTTCGTGTEVTNISILALISRRTKKGLANDEMFADKAVMIPELLKGLPFKFFATSSIDALIHAIESSLSPKANEITKLFGYKAIEMIIKGYQEIVAKGTAARVLMMKDFLIASNYAGISFGTAGCGAVHAMAYPLGGQYHVPHGESNYALFTGVMKKYMSLRTDGELAVMNEFLSKLMACEVSEVYEKLEDLLSRVLRKKPLREYGVQEAELRTFAESVVTNQQRLLGNSFVPMTTERVWDQLRKA